MRPNRNPIDQEVPFEISELFFSKTDKRGIILSGNDIFARISGYPLEHMVGKPHNLIRHPDMPKCVFKLFWNVVEANKPIVAYVKNMASDGRYYWVMAMAFPIEEGYISIRIKPTSEIFKLIPNLYKEILKFENTNGMDKALDFLNEKLKGLGFANYEAFMATVLVAEISNRNNLRSRPQEVQFHGTSIAHEHRRLAMTQTSLSNSCNKFFEIFDEIKNVMQKTSEFKSNSKLILEDCKNLKYLAINMTTDSERAGSEGFAIGIVSEKFRSWAEEIQAGINSFEEKMTSFESLATQAEVLLGTSRLQIEMTNLFIHSVLERIVAGNDLNENEQIELDLNLKTLASLANKNLEVAKHCTEDLLMLFMRLNSALTQLQMSITGMAVIHLSGKIESVRVNMATVNFATHVQGMSNFIESVKGTLRILEGQSTELIRGLSFINTDVRKVGHEIASIDSQASYTHAAM